MLNPQCDERRMRPICSRKCKNVRRSPSPTFHLSVSRKHINLPLMFLAVDLAGDFVRLFAIAHKNAEFILPMLPVPNRERPPAGHRHAHLADIFWYLISSHGYSRKKCRMESQKAPSVLCIHPAFCILHSAFSSRIISAPPPPAHPPLLPPPSSSASRQSAFPAPYPS